MSKSIQFQFLAFLTVAFGLTSSPCQAQVSSAPSSSPTAQIVGTATGPTSSQTVPALQQTEGAESLMIGPGDVLHIIVFDIPELEQRLRVSDAGTITVVLIGSIKVQGMSAGAAARTIEDELRRGGYILHPQVTVTLEQSTTLNVSILGVVRLPGSYPVPTPRDILDVLALSGGLAEGASHDITIERHSTGTSLHYSYSNDADKALASKVMVYPGDIVFVPKAGVVYVLGDVSRAGGFVMQNNEAKLTVLQAIALAGGTAHTAVPSHARLIRQGPNDTVADMALPLSDMQKGRRPDMQMQPGDIIYVPFSYVRNMAIQGAQILSTAASAAIYYH